MKATLIAVYRGGVFVPEETCDFPENSRVRVAVEGPLPEPERREHSGGRGSSRILPPREPDPEKRREILQRLVEFARSHPFSGDVPTLTRDELHERR
ncbi:MAG: DUF104 domain-containing protein [Planctomycetes bacterium]|nr:DUF104 domain-containing protein [Planctomycetota bacterium]